jgi:glyoxylase-like metal-dependent hydrolase (beta-lactamase superfamily II)
MRAVSELALYAFTCGHLTIPLGFLLAGQKGRIKVPVPSYLIAHPRGVALFDSGLNLASRGDPVAYMGEQGAKYATFHFDEGEEVAARLRALEIAPEDVTHLVNSHLHYDHSGGNAQLPNADVVVQRREWEHALSLPDDDPGYRRVDFDTGQRRQLISGEHDLFGDGTVTCFPTYGHTPGHQSLRVRTERGEFVLCGDACYLKRTLDELHLPGVLADREAALAALHRFRALQSAGAHILYGHDPEFWKSVPQAPERLG